MRPYGKNISVDGNGDDKFEILVLGLLKQISRRSTGALILSEIARNASRKVKIEPSVPPDSAGVDDRKKGGIAMDARVAYPPLPVPGAGIAIPGDQALLHRLVQAVHRIRGGFERAPMRNGFDNREEFYAILITNIYASEDRRPLRRDLHGFGIWDPGGTDAERFCFDTLGTIEALSQEGPGLGLRLFAGLSRVNAPFNPIRRYLEEKSAGFGYTVEAWARHQIRSPLPQTPAKQLDAHRLLGRRFMFNY
jgi:hypothetical protein